MPAIAMIIVSMWIIRVPLANVTFTNALTLRLLWLMMMRLLLLGSVRVMAVAHSVLRGRF